DGLPSIVRHTGKTIGLTVASRYTPPSASSAPSKGLKLIPVTTLKSAVSSLQALEQGHKVPSC
ncbi:hypothetical protein ACFWWB_00320, partial [Streptomyces sp. NPDC058690]